MFLSQSIQPDFCFNPDRMSLSHTWRCSPRKGLTVLNEDSKEEESDRDSPTKDKSSSFSPRRRFPHRLGYYHISTSFFGKRLSPSLDKTTRPLPPNLSSTTVSSDLKCISSLLEKDEEREYIYSFKVNVPLSFNRSQTVHGFYQAFSHDGKRFESPGYSEIVEDENEYVWKLNRTGDDRNPAMVDYYLLTVFLEPKGQANPIISKTTFTIHCPESNIRRIIEEEMDEERKKRKQLNTLVVQIFVHIFSFVLGLLTSKWLDI